MDNLSKLLGDQKFFGNRDPAGGKNKTPPKKNSPKKNSPKNSSSSNLNSLSRKLTQFAFGPSKKKKGTYAARLATGNARKYKKKSSKAVKFRYNNSNSNTNSNSNYNENENRGRTKKAKPAKSKKVAPKSKSVLGPSLLQKAQSRRNKSRKVEIAKNTKRVEIPVGTDELETFYTKTIPDLKKEGWKEVSKTRGTIIFERER